MCSLCNINILEDEYHFVLVCPFYSTIRDKYIKPYYYNTPSTFKLTHYFIYLYIIYMYAYKMYIFLQKNITNHPLSYFSFQPVLHDWCNKGCGMCYPVCGMVHIKEPLLLIEMSSPSGGSRFPISLSEWSYTICLT